MKYSTMNKLNNWISILAFCIIIGWLIWIDYSDLSWKTNKGAYLGLISMSLLVISGVVRYIKRKK